MKKDKLRLSKTKLPQTRVQIFTEGGGWVGSSAKLSAKIYWSQGALRILAKIWHETFEATRNLKPSLGLTLHTCFSASAWPPHIWHQLPNKKQKMAWSTWIWHSNKQTNKGSGQYTPGPVASYKKTWPGPVASSKKKTWPGPILFSPLCSYIKNTHLAHMQANVNTTTFKRSKDRHRG